MALIHVHARRSLQATDLIEGISPRYSLLLTSTVIGAPDVRLDWYAADSGINQHFSLSISQAMPSILLPRQHAHQFIVDALAQHYSGTFFDTLAAEEMPRRARAAWYVDQLDYTFYTLRLVKEGQQRTSISVWKDNERTYAVNDLTDPTNAIQHDVSRDDAVDLINAQMLLGCTVDVLDTTPAK